MHIDKFKKEDGSYYDENDICYENAEEFVQSKVFGFCMCGCALDNFVYIRDSLRLLRDYNLHDSEIESYEKFYKRYRAAVDAHFKSSGAEKFMWYWLDNKGYTEHGVALPGWLTEDGRQLLEDLEEITKEQIYTQESIRNLTQQESIDMYNTLVLPELKINTAKGT